MTTPSQPAEPTPAGASPVVALIDDDPSLYGPIRAVVEEALGPAASVWQYLHGLSAVRELPERRPELILLDMRLPDIDGLSVLKLLKGIPALRGVPVVMLSAQSYWQMLSIALDAGADSYVFKPFDFQTLVSVLREAWRRRAAAPRPSDPPST
ncbi:MAG TPA: response regulator [Planctomycetota bacterium]|nr:response regulator [Planctomycetota bacterium]